MMILSNEPRARIDYSPKITVEYLPFTPSWPDRFTPFAAAGGKRWKRNRQMKKARRMSSPIDDVMGMIRESALRCQAGSLVCF